MEHASAPDTLSFFSSVTLHGLASYNTNSGSGFEPLNLFRTQSFPGKRDKALLVEECATETDAEWGARPLPIGKPHADFKCPGGEPLPHDSLPGPLSEQLCIKLAKAEFIRSLAREAWFYEQFAREDGYQVLSKYEHGQKSSASPRRMIGSSYTYDRFYDDNITSCRFTDDMRTCRINCPWSLEQWISRTDCSPVVGILIMEELGDHFPSGPNPDQLLKDPEPEIMDILDDLSSAGVLHGDVKFNNLLRPASSSVSVPSPSSSYSSSSSASSSETRGICPRHNRVHSWRVIDFDRSTRWGKSIPQDVKRFIKSQKLWFRIGSFWGGGGT